MKKMKMMGLALILTLLMGSPAFAAETVVKEYTFVTENSSFESLTLEDLADGACGDIPLTIEEGDKSLKASEVTFSHVSTKEPITKEKEFPNLTEKTLPETYAFLEGELTLLDAVWTESQRLAAEGTKTYHGYVNKPDVPAEMNISVSLEDGSSFTVLGKLQKVEKDSSAYTEGFTVDAVFYGDEDVDSYILDDTEIPNNPKTPVFKGYEDVILKALGYPVNGEYVLTGGKWTTDYLVENGQTVRYAEFSGLRKSGNWTAYYKEDLNEDSPHLKTYSASATYTNGITKPVYEVKAALTYEEETQSITDKILTASAFVIIFAACITMILLVLGKKKKEKEKE